MSPNIVEEFVQNNNILEGPSRPQQLNESGFTDPQNLRSPHFNHEERQRSFGLSSN